MHLGLGKRAFTDESVEKKLISLLERRLSRGFSHAIRGRLDGI